MRPAALLLPALLAGCNGIQAMTGGQGRDSQGFNQLFTLFNIVCALFFLLVVAGLVSIGVWAPSERTKAASCQA
jgi:heme/copper-type cytochrome/quinol oxidase subunit 2